MLITNLSFELYALRRIVYNLTSGRFKSSIEALSGRRVHFLCRNNYGLRPAARSKRLPIWTGIQPGRHSVVAMLTPSIVMQWLH